MPEKEKIYNIVKVHLLLLLISFEILDVLIFACPLDICEHIPF